VTEPDPYIDDGAEDLDDREAAGYYDEDMVDVLYHPALGGTGVVLPDWLSEHFDTREEANGER
jgi:hypothetical protein